MPNQNPNSTIYIRNLPDKINKYELKSQLYFRFQVYGKIIDIVALKTKKLRGQAWIVFENLSNATAALRAEDGSKFYSKSMTIDYAKTQSKASIRDGEGVYNQAQKEAQSRMTISNASETQNGLKRAREAEELQRNSDEIVNFNYDSQLANNEIGNINKKQRLNDSSNNEG